MSGTGLFAGAKRLKKEEEEKKNVCAYIGAHSLLERQTF